jgi:hypothetical protein
MILHFYHENRHVDLSHFWSIQVQDTAIVGKSVHCPQGKVLICEYDRAYKATQCYEDISKAILDNAKVLKIYRR